MFRFFAPDMLPACFYVRVRCFANTGQPVVCYDAILKILLNIIYQSTVKRIDDPKGNLHIWNYIH